MFSIELTIVILFHHVQVPKGVLSRAYFLFWILEDIFCIKSKLFCCYTIFQIHWINNNGKLKRNMGWGNHEQYYTFQKFCASKKLFLATLQRLLPCALYSKKLFLQKTVDICQYYPPPFLPKEGKALTCLYLRPEGLNFRANSSFFMIFFILKKGA